jgi:hypothetical protein
MESLPADTLLHIVNMLVRKPEQHIIDYRIFRVVEPGVDGKLRQLQTDADRTGESMAALLQQGYAFLKVVHHDQPGRISTQYWAHIVKYN